MKAHSLVAALLFAAPALAAPPPIPTPRPLEEISCSFTEPFINVDWSEATGRVRIVDAMKIEWDENGRVINDNAETKEGFAKVRTGKNTFEIRNSKGEVAVHLTLDFNGNNGMSDVITPYSGVMGSLHGGCSSSYYEDQILE
jgi:hypothetical protein